MQAIILGVSSLFMVLKLVKHRTRSYSSKFSSLTLEYCFQDCFAFDSSNPCALTAGHDGKNIEQVSFF